MIRSLYSARTLSIVVLLAVSAGGSQVLAAPHGYFANVNHIGEKLDRNSFEFLPVMTSDQLTLYFSDSPGVAAPRADGSSGGEDIWLSTRTSERGTFHDAVNLTTINSPADDTMGDLSADGLSLYFGSNRSGNWDLYRAARETTSVAFTQIEPLGIGVNTNDANENGPRVTADGLTLVFQRQASGNQPDGDLWIATRSTLTEPFGDAAPLDATINCCREGFPTISSDGLAVFWSDSFESDENRPEGAGGNDIWVATRERLDQPFSDPTNLNELWPGTVVNDHRNQGTPYISREWPANGAKLYYVNDRDGTFDVYEATWRSTSAPGDFDRDGSLTTLDIDALSRAIRADEWETKYDLDSDLRLTVQDRKIWVATLKQTWFGDGNLDGLFDSEDLIAAFASGLYEDDASGNATWSTGDWNGDGFFRSDDLIAAFGDGGYAQGQRVASAVPEPGAIPFTLIIAFALWSSQRHGRVR